MDGRPAWTDCDEAGAHASFLLRPFPFLVCRFFPENSNLGITGRITWFIRVDN